MYIDQIREKRDQLEGARAVLEGDIGVHEAAEGFAKTTQWQTFAESLAQARTAAIEKMVLRKTNDRERVELAAEACLYARLQAIPKRAELCLPQMREQLEQIKQQIAKLDRQVQRKEGGPDARERRLPGG